MSSNVCKDCGVCCQAFVVQRNEPIPKAIRVKLDTWGTKHLIKLDEEQVLALDIVQANAVKRTYEVGSFYQACDLHKDGKCSDYSNRPQMCSSFPSDERSGSPYKIGCALIAEKFGEPKQLIPS